MTTRIHLFLLCMIALVPATGQRVLQPLGPPDPQAPEWARMMYSADPDVRAVTAAYQAYYGEHPFVKTQHTQYYKLWLSRIRGSVDGTGHFAPRSGRYMNERRGHIPGDDADRDAGWVCVGPSQIYAQSDGHEMEFNANTFCIDRSASSTNVMYCGTESGGAYKSTNSGVNWTPITGNIAVNMIEVIRVQPTSSSTVLMGAAGKLWRTVDEGTNWTVVGTSTLPAFVNFWEISWDPLTANTVLMATEQGLYRSTNAGTDWTLVLSGKCTSVVHRPYSTGTPIAYAITYQTTTGVCKFYKSTDAGATWTLKSNGWWTPPAGQDTCYDIRAGRIGVSEADANKVYALLVGYQLDGATITTNGYLGVWRSDNAGEAWTHPHGQVGAPYAQPGHPNLMNFHGNDVAYTQLEYNTCIAVSQLDANKVLIGGLSLWQSSDGCASYQPKGAYVVDIYQLHPDMQEMRIYKTGPMTEEVWIANDGGVRHSTDFFTTSTVRCNGIDGVELWGYDQGWHDDVRVGGRYHNGNMAYREGYPGRSYLQTGGGERPTGYVNLNDEHEAYYSDQPTTRLPASIGASMSTSGALGDTVNEGYWRNSSRVMSDQRYYDMLWLGKKNKLMRSVDDGATFEAFHTFGTDPDDRVLWFEQCMADPKVMVLQQIIDNISHLWRTVDGGLNWTEVTLPAQLYDMYVTQSGTDPAQFWVAFTYGGNGAMVYRTDDGGANWQNLTTAALDNEEVWGLTHQIGTNGGVYVALLNGRVLYRNNAMSDWSEYSAGLPMGNRPLRIVPYLRGGKIRIANYGHSLWQRDLFESSTVIADFCTEAAVVPCSGDPVHFVDHSVCSTTATYAWSFPGGVPSTSTARDPTVVYNTPGMHTVTLTVTQSGTPYSKTKTAFVGSYGQGAPPITETFETGTLPVQWVTENSAASSSGWAVKNGVGAYGTSSWCMWYPNFDINEPGLQDDMRFRVDLTGTTGMILWFDVAYSQFDDFYSDTLAVLVSTDCGLNWTEVYRKGGDQLATSPDVAFPFTPSATQWRRESVPLQQFASAGQVLIAFQDRNRWGQQLFIDNVNVAAGVQVNAKAWLEGPYDSGTLLMRDDLRAAGLVPVQEPYTALGFTQAAGGGGEIVPPSVLTVTGNNAIVDWVLLELRANTTPFAIVATRAALLQRDGDIVGLDGLSPVTFQAAAGTYRLAVRHRNHQGIMRGAGNALTAAATTIDLRVSGTTTYGTAARKAIGTAQVMWAGNARPDAVLKYTGSSNDRDPVLVRVGSTTPNSVVAGYFLEDVNLSGTVKYTGTANDRDPILVNIGSTTPNNVRTEQLP